MEKIKVEVEVTKEAYELSQGIMQVVSTVAQCLKDGWQPGLDVPVIMTSCLSDLGAALQGVNLLKGEFRGDPQAASLAIVLPIAEELKKLL